jgi:uncharacterized membrane protein YphA (DoxX/SURF4 family)
MFEKETRPSYLALKIAYGVVPFVAGLDKFTNLLTHWDQYLSPMATRMLPLGPSAFMHLVGIVEMVVGLAVLTKWTRVGAYVASAWLALIALNLIASGHYLDVAARDAVMAVGAYALARLDEVRHHATSSGPSEAGGFQEAHAHG